MWNDCFLPPQSPNFFLVILFTTNKISHIMFFRWDQRESRSQSQLIFSISFCYFHDGAITLNQPRSMLSVDLPSRFWLVEGRHFVMMIWGHQQLGQSHHHHKCSWQLNADHNFNNFQSWHSLQYSSVVISMKELIITIYFSNLFLMCVWKNDRILYHNRRKLPQT